MNKITLVKHDSLILDDNLNKPLHKIQSKNSYDYMTLYENFLLNRDTNIKNYILKYSSNLFLKTYYYLFK